MIRNIKTLRTLNAPRTLIWRYILASILLFAVITLIMVVLSPIWLPLLIIGGAGTLAEKALDAVGEFLHRVFHLDAFLQRLDAKRDAIMRDARALSARQGVEG